MPTGSIFVEHSLLEQVNGMHYNYGEDKNNESPLQGYGKEKSKQLDAGTQLHNYAQSGKGVYDSNIVSSYFLYRTRPYCGEKDPHFI